jgi:hypothetical protein
MAKSRAAQPESEGIVGPHAGASASTTNAVTNNAPGGRVPAVVGLTGQVSAREWPARPGLTTPAAVGRAITCENCNGRCGWQPGSRGDAGSTRRTISSGGVTSPGGRGSW